VTTVLLVRLSAMGDVVQTLGAVAALHRARPDWRLVFVTQTTFAPLLAGLPGIAQVLTFARRGGLRGLLALRRQLQALRADLALDLQGNWKSALIARSSGARDVVGLAAAWRQEPWSRVLLHRVVPGGGVPHPARTAFELVQHVAPGAQFELPRLVATDGERQRELASLAAIGVDATRPFAVIVGTDPRDPRALRPGRVPALAAALAMPCVWLLGPAEAALDASAGLPTLHHGPGEVRRLIALGSLLAAARGEVVGPDQGATHVLAAAGARCRVLFGPQDPLRTAPPAAVALVHPQGPTCRPCRASVCRHRDGPVCMEFGLEEGVPVVPGFPSNLGPLASAPHRGPAV
jgi:ADP-heptose:LPS heptosyltransferase